jgi:alkanesulfonate monooxygenase SsuD/methylene tetrahydromethanopterin reductase-like flavin-dependent oxidoreductase (luciferase family)
VAASLSRGSLDRHGLGGLGDTVAAGDESVVADEVRRYAEAGATELILFPSGTPDDRPRTIAVFAELAREVG